MILETRDPPRRHESVVAGREDAAGVPKLFTQNIISIREEIKLGAVFQTDPDGQRSWRFAFQVSG